MNWDELERVLSLYYNSLPEPKKSYLLWWYGENGMRDMLKNFHKLDNGYEKRFELKEEK